MGLAHVGEAGGPLMVWLVRGWARSRSRCLQSGRATGAAEDCVSMVTIAKWVGSTAHCYHWRQPYWLRRRELEVFVLVFQLTMWVDFNCLAKKERERRRKRNFQGFNTLYHSVDCPCCIHIVRRTWRRDFYHTFSMVAWKRPESSPLTVQPINGLVSCPILRIYTSYAMIEVSGIISMDWLVL